MALHTTNSTFQGECPTNTVKMETNIPPLQSRHPSVTVKMKTDIILLQSKRRQILYCYSQNEDGYSPVKQSR